MLNYLDGGRRWLANPYEYLDAHARAHGRTFHAHLPVLGRTLFTGDPNVIEAIQREETLEAGRAITIVDKALGAKSLITLDGAVHAQRKRLVAALMTERSAARFDELTIERTRRALDRVSPGVPFSAYDLVREVSIRVITSLMFGEMPESESDAICAAGLAFIGALRSPLPLLVPVLRRNLGPWSPWGRVVRKRRVIERIVLDRLAAASTEASPTLISALRDERARDPELSPGVIAAEALALFTFGHDTAAATLAWAFAHVYADPALVTRLRKAEHASDRLVDACLRESMRLCPVVVHLSRRAQRSTRVAGHAVERGEIAAPSAYLAHRNPNVFDEPDHFRADRFLDAEPPPFSYFPFGLGQRTCIGRRLAERQMRLVLGIAVREYSLKLAISEAPRPRRKMVLVMPEQGTLLVRER